MMALGSSGQGVFRSEDFRRQHQVHGSVFDGEGGDRVNPDSLKAAIPSWPGVVAGIGKRIRPRAVKAIVQLAEFLGE